MSAAIIKAWDSGLSYAAVAERLAVPLAEVERVMKGEFDRRLQETQTKPTEAAFEKTSDASRPPAIPAGSDVRSRILGAHVRGMSAPTIAELRSVPLADVEAIIAEYDAERRRRMLSRFGKSTELAKALPPQEGAPEQVATLAASVEQNVATRAAPLPFTPSEAVALGRQLEELERPKAQEHQSEAGKERGRGQKASGNLHEAKGMRTGRTSEIVGEAVGMTFDQQAARIAELVARDWSHDAIASHLNVSPAFVVRALRGALAPKPAENSTPEPTLSREERKALRRAARRALRRAERPAKLPKLPKIYLPTHEEILSCCEEIQRGWSPWEKRMRWLYAHSIGPVCSDDLRWTVPTMTAHVAA